MGCRPVSLNLTPESFKIDKDYEVPEGKSILLLMPDNGFKPYKKAAHNQGVREYLQNRFGNIEEIHFATLVGLYGPVPEELENKREVLQNCYSLTTSSVDKNQRKLVATRLDDYIKQIGYKHCVAYITKGALRKICLTSKSIDVIPEVMKVHSKGFLNEVNLDELGGLLRATVRK